MGGGVINFLNPEKRGDLLEAAGRAGLTENLR